MPLTDEEYLAIEKRRVKHFKIFMIVAVLIGIFVIGVYFTERDLFARYEKDGCAVYVKRCVECQEKITQQWDANFVNHSPIATVNPERFDYNGSFNYTPA